MLWHCLTIFGTLVYHHETMCRAHSWSWYDLDRWPQDQINGLWHGFVFRSHVFMSFDIVMLCLAREWVYHHSTMWRAYSRPVWPWTLTLILKLYFHREFESGKIVFALRHRHTKFWNMVILAWNNMLCTHLTFVCPLTYMWMAGRIISFPYSLCIVHT